MFLRLISVSLPRPTYIFPINQHLVRLSVSDYFKRLKVGRTVGRHWCHTKIWKTRLLVSHTQQNAPTVLRDSAARGRHTAGSHPAAGKQCQTRCGLTCRCAPHLSTNSHHKIAWEHVCMRQPTCLLYLPAGLHWKKKQKKKQPTKAAGAFSCLDDCLLTSSLLNPVFLSAAASGLRACKMFPLICLYTCSACLCFFFFFLFHHWKIWSCGCVTSRYTRRRGTHWKLRRLLLSLILCLLT